MRKYKLAYFVTHPIQYQAPLLKELSERKEIELKVFFVKDFSLDVHVLQDFPGGAEWDTPLLSGYEYSFLSKISNSDASGFFMPIVYGFKKALKEKRWDAVWIHGYNHYSLIIVMILSCIFRIPIFYRSESNLKSTSSHPLKNMLVRALVKLSSGLLFIGKENKEYYKFYGASEDKLFFTPYAVNNKFFSKQPDQIQRTTPELIERLQINDETIVILFSGKLIKRKNPALLLEAFYNVIKNDLDRLIYLIFVGHGSEYQSLEKRIQELKLEDKVKLAGFQNQGEIRQYYSIADLLVLPSNLETFGLVINEAMNASTAIISSDKVGAASDLVFDGLNGFTFQSDNLESLTDALKKALFSKQKLRDMCNQSLKIIDRWNYEENVKGIIAALQSLNS